MELLVQHDGEKDDLLQTNKNIMNFRPCFVPDIQKSV